VANSAALGSTTDIGTGTISRSGRRQSLLLRIGTWFRRPLLDARIARGAERPGDRATALREAQLIAQHERRRLALRFERILRNEARPRGPSSAAPIDYGAVQVAKPVLVEIVLSLLSSEAVTARGVALGRRLLTDPCSPIYAPEEGRTGGGERLWRSSITVLLALGPVEGAHAGAPAATPRASVPA
jgi:hypothetical protein